jgi:hypothetical protein
MGIRNDASNLIFFADWDRRRLPAGRQGIPKRPIINYAPIIFLPLMPTGKVADNQEKQLHLLWEKAADHVFSSPIDESRRICVFQICKNPREKTSIFKPKLAQITQNQFFSS